MKKLSVRLQAVADMIRPGSRVADIGTDHALLPVYLIQSGRAPLVIASDVKEGPAASARQTVAQAGVTTSISVRVGDGLATVQPHEVDDVVIAGMGGETIAQILAAAPWIKDTRLRFVLQPMSKPELLREYLYQNGFSIENEQVLEEQQHIYVVMLATFTGKTANATYADCILGKVPRTPLGKMYIEIQQSRVLQHLVGLEKAGNAEDERRQLQECATQLQEWLSKI